MTTEKEHLQKLTEATLWALDQLDREMKKPSTPERGKIIAAICNHLELANDSAMHFGLDLSMNHELLID